MVDKFINFIAQLLTIRRPLSTETIKKDEKPAQSRSSTLCSVTTQITKPQEKILLPTHVLDASEPKQASVTGVPTGKVYYANLQKRHLASV